MPSDLLHLDNVSKSFNVRGAEVQAVKSISLGFSRNMPRIIALAGESGSGKSTLAMMAMGFMPSTRGTIRYRDRDIGTLDRAGKRAFRRNVQAVLQNPFETFNPFYKAGHIVDLALRQLSLAPEMPAARQKLAEAMDLLKLAPDVLKRYPHQLSGGQLQRLSLVRSLLLSPEILIADEPVSMIDASLRWSILQQLVFLKTAIGTSILYITHDLSTALQISDELLIAHKGEIVERGDPQTIIGNPQHPYTHLLVGSVPVPDPGHRWSARLESPT